MGHSKHSCSFCGKQGRDVQKLIEGPDGNICNECTLLCMDILADSVARTHDSTVRDTLHEAPDGILATAFSPINIIEPSPQHSPAASRKPTPFWPPSHVHAVDDAPLMEFIEQQFPDHPLAKFARFYRDHVRFPDDYDPLTVGKMGEAAADARAEAVLDRVQPADLSILTPDVARLVTADTCRSIGFIPFYILDAGALEHDGGPHESIVIATPWPSEELVLAASSAIKRCVGNHFISTSVVHCSEQELHDTIARVFGSNDQDAPTPRP